MKVLILTENFSCKVIKELKKEKFIKVYVSYDYQDISEKYNIVFAHNYDKIIPESYFSLPEQGVFVIHSTDLPKGRGWAPIYYSIVEKEQQYTISLLRISKKIDEGNIYIKLKIRKPKYISNENLRDIDEDGSILIIKKFINMVSNNTISKQTVGLMQDNKKATYYKKRTPEDNYIDKHKTLKEAIYEILATNTDYPAYIQIGREKIYLYAKTDTYYQLIDLEYHWEITV